LDEFLLPDRFASVVLVVAAMILLSAVKHGHVNAALAPWLDGLIRVLGPLGCFALMGALATLLIKR
jgi:hypothetical protein